MEEEGKHGGTLSSFFSKVQGEGVNNLDDIWAN